MVFDEILAGLYLVEILPGADGLRRLANIAGSVVPVRCYFVDRSSGGPPGHWPTLTPMSGACQHPRRQSFLERSRAAALWTRRLLDREQSANFALMGPPAA